MPFYMVIMGLAVLVLFPCCMVGPKYQRPTVAIPEKYKHNQESIAGANLAGWWTFFHDQALEALIQKAIANNYDLRIAIEKITQARAFFRIQEANLMPEIDLVGAVNRSGYSKNLASSSFLTNKTLSYFQVGFDGVWELDFWGKLRHAKESAYDQFQAQVESMRDVYIMLLSDVAKAYVDGRSLQKKIDLQEQQVAIDTRLLGLTHNRFSSGIDSKIPDVDQQAALNESKNQLLILQTSFKQTVIGLAILLGQNPEDFTFPAGAHKVPQSHKKLEVGLPSDLLRARPDIRQAERILAASNEDVGQAIAEWFPSFSLLGSAAFESNKASTWFSGDSLSWSIGPSVNWRIITFGRIRYNIKEKESLKRQALLSYAKSVVRALGDVESWLVAYFNGLEQQKVLKNKLSAATQKSDLTKALFASGIASKIDFLFAEKNRLAIDLELTASQQAATIALISVYKSLGGGW